MAIHWQPPDANPVEEFTPEPLPSVAPTAAASPVLTAAADTGRMATLLDGLLLTAAGVAFGAVLFAVYWTLR